MSILGSLIVNLTAETSSFVTGMSGAAKTAKTTGREISGAFSELGDIAATALAPFGEIGQAVSGTLEKIGTSAGAAMQTFGRMGGVAGVGIGAFAAAGAAVLALDAGAIALAIHTAETTAALGEMAQKAGVSSQSFAGLALAGKQVGVDNEALAKALGFMNNTAVKAAIAVDYSATAFGRMGIQVKNAQGGMRDTSDIFLDVVRKISGTAGPEQGFLVRQIFGRGGMAIIPLINEGVDRIIEKTELAKTFGLGDPAAVASSQKFKETVEDLRAALDGAALSLTKQILPALQYVAELVEQAFKTGAVQGFVDKIAELVKQTFILGYELAHLGDVSIFGKPKAALTELFGTLEVGVTKTQDALVGLAGATGAPGEEVAAAHKRNADAIAFYWADTAKKVNKNLSGISWSQYKTDVENFASGLDAAKAKGPFDWADPLLSSLSKPKAKIDLGQPAHKDAIVETINKLQAQVAEQQAIAAAIGQTTSAQLLATAAAAADKAVTDADNRAKEQGHKVTQTQAKTIHDLAFAHALNADVLKDSKGLDDFIQKTQIQTKGLQALGSAYATLSPLEVLHAQEAEKLAPFAKQISDLDEMISSLRKAGASSTVLQPLVDMYQKLEGQFRRAQSAMEAMDKAQEDVKLGEAINNLRLQSASIDTLIPIALKGASAMRAFNIEQQVKKFQDEHPLLDPAQIDQYRQKLAALDNTKLAMAAADKVAASQNLLATREELDQLDALQKAEIAHGVDTTATDLLIYQTKTKALTQYFESAFQAQNAELLGNVKLYDMQAQLIKQWDESQFKVGNFANRVKAVFNELALQGREAGSQIARAFVSAFDNASGELAHLIVTGKANFLNVLQSLEQSVIKAGIQKAVGGLLGGIGLNIPGLTPGAQLGFDAGHPMFVTVTNFGGGLFPTAASSETGIGSGPNIGGAQGGGIGTLNAGSFAQSLNTMSAAQNVFASKFNGSWLGIGANFLRHMLSMTGLFHAHTAAVIVGQAAQTGAVAAGQAAQTAVTTAGAASRSGVGAAEAKAGVLRHAASAAAAVFHKVIEALPFPVNVILAPVAAAGTFAGVLAWGALAGSAAKGALLGEDMPIFAHAREMILPAGISEGLQGMIRASQNSPSVPSVSQFSGANGSGSGDTYNAHVHMGDVHAWDTTTGAQQLKKLQSQMIAQMRRAFQTGHLDVRRLARI